MVLNKIYSPTPRIAVTFGLAFFFILIGSLYFFVFEPGNSRGLKALENHYIIVSEAGAGIASQASLGQTHLLLYLLYHDEADRAEVETQLEALDKSVKDLEGLVAESRLIKLSAAVKSWAVKTPGAVSGLLEYHDMHRKGDTPFNFAANKQELLDTHRFFSRIRILGGQMNALALELQKEVQLAIETVNQKRYDRFYIGLCIISGLVLLIGGFWVKAFVALIGETRQRKAAETAGIVQEEKYKALFNNMTVGVLFLEADGVVSDVNPAALEMFGQNRSQFLDKTPRCTDWRVIREDGSEFPVQDHPSALALSTGKTVKDVVAGIWNLAAQSFNWVSITAVPRFMPGEEKPWQVFVTMLDITPRKQFELALKQSEKKLLMLHDQTEQLSLAAARMISIDHREDIFQTISNAIVEYSDYQRVIISLFKDDFPFRDIVGFSGISKERVDRLRDVEFPKTWYDGVFAQGITIGQFSYYIPHTMKQILNQEAVYYGDGPVPDLEGVWHPEDNLFVRLNDDTGRFIGVISVDNSKSGEIPSAGTIRPLEIFSVLISQIISFKREQEMKEDAEARLSQAMKMESIGTLAGGIAHDLNNILGIVVGNTELGLEAFPQDHPNYENLSEIRDAGLRAADIVRQLLSFSDKAEQTQSAMDIVPVIHDSLSFMRSSIPATVDIDSRITSERAVVMADPIQINRMLMNLCINAFQAMPDEKGRIEISAETVEITKNNVQVFRGLTPGPYIRIIISDNGVGIAPDIRDRIFDPYFTSKGMGKGSGMGLAVVSGIVNAHKGAIWMDTPPRPGSRFVICLPMVFGSQGALPEEKSLRPAPGHERILFVDEDPAVTGINKNNLTRMGYQVKVSNDPFQALALFRADPARFDLVITAMAMPGMTGKALAKAIMGYSKDVPVILCTGPLDTIDEVSAIEQGISAIIAKPVAFEKLGKTIRRLLNNTSRDTIMYQGRDI